MDVHAAGQDIEHIFKQTLYKIMICIKIFLKFSTAFWCLMTNMTIKSAERLVDILETWCSNLVKQTDYPGLGEYVRSGHPNLRISSKAERALLNKPLT